MKLNPRKFMGRNPAWLTGRSGRGGKSFNALRLIFWPAAKKARVKMETLSPMSTIVIFGGTGGIGIRACPQLTAVAVGLRS